MRLKKTRPVIPVTLLGLSRNGYKVRSSYILTMAAFETSISDPLSEGSFKVMATITSMELFSQLTICHNNQEDKVTEMIKYVEDIWEDVESRSTYWLNAGYFATGHLTIGHFDTHIMEDN